MMHRETQAPGLPAPRARQSRGRGPAHRAGPHPGRPRPRPRRAGAYRGHRHPDHRRHQRRRRVRQPPRGLAHRPARCLRRALHPACSGSRSWSCSAACPGAARQGSARTAPCRTDRSAALRHPTPPRSRSRRRSIVGIQPALDAGFPPPFAPYMLSAKQEHRVWRLRRDGSTAAPTATDGI